MNLQLIPLKRAHVMIQQLFAAAWFAMFFTLAGLPWTRSWAHNLSSAWADFAVHGPARSTPKSSNESVAPKVIPPQRPGKKHREPPPEIDGWWV